MYLNRPFLTTLFSFPSRYMHNPRGSNNRLNERSANRNNGNRMFDSQVRDTVANNGREKVCVRVCVC